jgi:hypothetical protein
MDWPIALVIITVGLVLNVVLWRMVDVWERRAHARLDEQLAPGYIPAPTHVTVPVELFQTLIRETGDAIAKSLNPPPLAQVADEDGQFGPDDDETADALEGVEDWTEAWLPTDPGDGPKVALRAGDDGGPGIDWGPDS